MPIGWTLSYLLLHTFAADAKALLSYDGVAQENRNARDIAMLNMSRKWLGEEKSMHSHAIYILREAGSVDKGGERVRSKMWEKR